jgi:GNAT superfamily N-acetyltransferase
MNRSMEAPSAVQVRRAGSEDAEAFTAQRGALFRELGLLAPGVDAERFDAATRSAFRTGVERGTCIAWLASLPGGEIVGSSALTLLERLPSPSNPSPVEGYLAHLFVVPSQRRSGVGSALMNAAIGEARARRMGRIRLHATEPGRALYERLGFRLRTNDMELALGSGAS